MKKYLFYVFVFIALFFSFTGETIDAKTETIGDVSVWFGNDVFQIRTTSIDTFKIKEDNTFYFDGNLYEFNEDFTLVNDTIVVENNAFVINSNNLTLDKDEKTVNSSVAFETYSFPVNVILNSDYSYEFEQELCYKIKNEIRKCHIDEDDKTVAKKSSSYSYYYDFMPFYKDDIVFEEITFNITLTNIKTSEKLLFRNLSFSESEIVYKNYFDMGLYQNMVTLTRNDNLTFVGSLTSDSSGILYTYAYFAPGREYTSDAVYDMSFIVCVGDHYEKCVTVYSNEENYDVPINVGYYYEIPLSVMDKEDGNMVKYLMYDRTNKSVNYDSFLLKASYTCKKNCTNLDSNATSFTDEVIYYLNIKNSTYIGELNGIVADCDYNTCYASNSSVTNKVEFSDDNGIEEIYYYIDNSSSRDDNKFINSIANGENITFGEDLTGLVYLHFKVKDGSGSIRYFTYRYFFDKDSPYMTNNNFSSYNSNYYYNEVTINVTFSDKSAPVDGVYYLIRSIDEEVTIEDFLDEENIYTGSVTLNKNSHLSGIYKVCFLAKDLVGNYSEIECNNYKLDVDDLTKDEITIETAMEGYTKSKSIMIRIDGVDGVYSFNCKMVRKNLVLSDKSELDSLCYVNKYFNYEIQDEGEYQLWIYASDGAENYMLLKLDEIFYYDGLAPVISYIVNGDNKSYTNNVSVSVTATDKNDVASEAFYSFYLKTYSESDLNSFNINEVINYPFDYYGEYKLAIKVCDVIGNCDVNVVDGTFLIDTAEIKMEILGDEEITILRWGKYKEYGIKATKGNRGKYPVAVNYTISSNVDVSKTGEYYVTYSSQEGVNYVSITRKVIVKDSLPYIGAFLGLIIVGEAFIFTRLFIKKRKNDSI